MFPTTRWATSLRNSSANFPKCPTRPPVNTSPRAKLSGWWSAFSFALIWRRLRTPAIWRSCTTRRRERAACSRRALNTPSNWTTAPSSRCTVRNWTKRPTPSASPTRWLRARATKTSTSATASPTTPYRGRSSTICFAIRPSAWNGRSMKNSSATRTRTKATPDASAQVYPACQTARYCFCNIW